MIEYESHCVLQVLKSFGVQLFDLIITQLVLFNKGVEVLRCKKLDLNTKSSC